MRKQQKLIWVLEQNKSPLIWNRLTQKLTRNGIWRSYAYNEQTARNGFQEKITPKKDLVHEQIIKEFVRIKQVAQVAQVAHVAAQKRTYPTAKPTTAITGNTGLDVKISSNNYRNSEDNSEENRN